MSEPRADPPHMPDYGIDLSSWQPLPWSWAASRLVSARNYWLTTVSSDGRPHSLPVWGVWDDHSHRFFFSCAPSSRKARNLSANPSCVVSPENTVECVSVEGVARTVTEEHIGRWVRHYLDKYVTFSTDLDASFVTANQCFEVLPERVFGIIERDDEFATRATRWTFN